MRLDDGDAESRARRDLNQFNDVVDFAENDGGDVDGADLDGGDADRMGEAARLAGEGEREGVPFLLFLLHDGEFMDCENKVVQSGWRLIVIVISPTPRCTTAHTHRT